MSARRLEPDYTKVARFIGRTYKQVNCWDLVREFYMIQFGIELRQYYQGSTPKREEVSSLIHSNKGDFERVEGEPFFGDLMLIRLRGMECHIGVFIQKGKFLHSTESTGSVLDSVDKYKTNIVGYYRHKAFP